ncbi:MAG: cAMP-activated global transcriptional regulator CRP [Xanthomonadales bacterium]|nr:cAMP-activated global transcriptional regulator CRP [Xanthomonadales bacterium]
MGDPLREPDSQALEDFLSFCHRRSYPPKSPVIRPGDLADTLYYIVSGSCSVTTEDEEGRELILAYLNQGEFIGEIGLFMHQDRRGVLVKTRTKCELAQISYQRLEQLLNNELKEDCPFLLYAIGCQLSDRLLHTSRKVRRLAFLDVTGRVARTLLDLCEEPDAMTHPDGMQIKISRQEISRIVGCSREMAGRVLKALEEEGMVSVSGKTIVVFDNNGDT